MVGSGNFGHAGRSGIQGGSTPSKSRICCGIYKIVFHTPSGTWFYIGSSKDLDGRFKSHLYDLKKGIHANPHCQTIWTKYQDAELVLLEECLDENLLDREQAWLDSCWGNPFLLNVNPTAICPPSTKGQKRSDKFKEKMRSIALKGG